MRNKFSNYGTLIIIFVSFTIIVVQTIKAFSTANTYTYAGLCLMIPSLVCFAIARIQLGSSFQVSAEANDLVTEGIYKKIRHPVYLFGSLFLLGVILFIQQFYVLIIWAILIYIQTLRIKKEEKVLGEKFGEQYEKYKKRTWF